ncbi:hypothetical protein [Mucilaginibacter pedocola]|uniref:Uncharacterized protein n=1 Tax=Mucilaginibacter pedocola TaxID=1792845 RepID=A0A1S9PG53_9SPHI|nr:hypothetical protein [Mucilaginibacter pedocola]OOQ59965.1 hypothetical protein BC343_27830 [Mucilaginibacter pedocola]
MTIKKTLLLLAIAGFGLASCDTKTATPPAAEVSSAETPDSNVISLAAAKKYVAQYKQHAGTVDSITPERKIIQVENTRAIWLDSARLIKMLGTLRKEKGDGVRVYLATYDIKVEENANGTFDKKYAGYNTLVLVSTKDSVNKKNQHFHRDYYSDKTANGPATGFIVGNPPTNRGEMCPPPRDCPSIGATLIE